MRTGKHSTQIIDNIKRITAILMMIFVLMFLLLSIHIIAHEEYHECTGDDCPVCALIQISSNGLRELCGGTPAIATISVIIIFSLMVQIISNETCAISTPVTRKTRLNN